MRKSKYIIVLIILWILGWLLVVLSTHFTCFCNNNERKSLKNKTNKILEQYKNITSFTNFQLLMIQNSRLKLNLMHIEGLISKNKATTAKIDREINDTRPTKCKAWNYKSSQKASVIIPFYNEDITLLLRAIHSVIKRSPKNLLQEIILVDDGSASSHALETLQIYLELFPAIKLIRNDVREGLVKSRIRGASISQGEVLIFLDANTEVNVGWLEPILDYLHSHPKSVVQPFVDGIDAVDFEYKHPTVIYRPWFTFDLRLVWLKTPDHIQDYIREGNPYFSPVLVGCAIAISKQYYQDIGQFDSGQLIWGGENIELPFRTWMCGGQVVTLTCSRVGHVFKENPFTKEKDWVKRVQINLIRIAEVWMGEYKKLFYLTTEIYKDRRVNLTSQDLQTINERRKLKKSLECKSFDWFLNTVVPEMFIPPDDAVQHGEIANLHTSACWEELADGYIGMTYDCYIHRSIPENTFTLDKHGFLRYKNKCVKFMYPKPTLSISACPDHSDAPLFTKFSMVYNGNGNYDREIYGQLRLYLYIDNEVKRWCVAQVTSIVLPHLHIQMPQVAVCDSNSKFQYWAFTYRLDRKFK